jgi:hypothetical protein
VHVYDVSDPVQPTEIVPATPPRLFMGAAVALAGEEDSALTTSRVLLLGRPLEPDPPRT